MQNSQPLDLEEALARLFEKMPRIGEHTADEAIESIPLDQARGRILARQLSAPISLPPFPCSAMDGYAIRSADLQSHLTHGFSVIGQSLAGHPYAEPVGAGQCVRIFTGAALPSGCDQVLLQENVDQMAGNMVTFHQHKPTESYVRAIGHDIEQGACIAQAGDVLDAFLLGSIAAAGISQVSVFKRPKVGVFSTGDELVDPGVPPTELQPGQIYDSNRFTVLNLLANCPCELLDLGRLADDPKQVETAFQHAAQQCDVLITSGGVSVGDADFITSTIASLGQIDFWKLNLKPGKPLAVGKIGDCHVFGLPGNPVSTIVTLLLVAKPALWHLAGTTPPPTLRMPAILKSPLSHSPGRAEFQRGTLCWEDGNWVVTHTGDQSSNRLTSFKDANCLIEVQKEDADLKIGTTVNTLPFRALLD